jgi:hypothetical protein
MAHIVNYLTTEYKCYWLVMVVVNHWFRLSAEIYEISRWGR